MPLDDLTDESLASGDDDASLLSMADFFSLLSLALIYMAVVFGSPSGPRSIVEGSVEVVRASVVGVGPAASVVEGMAYVSILPVKGAAAVRVLAPGSSISEKNVALDTIDTTRVSEWVVEQLAKGAQIQKVTIYMAGEDPRPEVNLRFMSVLRGVQKKYPVVRVIL